MFGVVSLMSKVWQLCNINQSALRGPHSHGNECYIWNKTINLVEACMFIWMSSFWFVTKAKTSNQTNRCPLEKNWFRMSLYVFAHDDFLPKSWWVSGQCISYKTHSSDKPCVGVWEHLHLTHETNKVLSWVFCIINTVYEPTANTIIFACWVLSWLFTSSSLEVWAALCNLVMKSMAVFGHSDVQQGDTVLSSHSLSLKSKV